MPKDSMALVKTVLRDVITPHRGGLLSFGIIGTIWAASGGFSSMMESLNVAYDVEENRPFWKTRPLAIGLTFLIGFLLIVALALMLVGPNFGGWLAAKVGLSTIFAAIWPYLRWAIAIVFTSSEEQHQSGPTRHRFQFISSCGVDRSTLRRWT